MKRLVISPSKRALSSLMTARKPVAQDEPSGIHNGLAIDQDIFERVQGAILEQRLPPGTQLTEERLSEVFEVSRARVRRVLLRLAESKCVVMRPNRGAFVAQPTPKEVHDVFVARRVLEAQIVREVVTRFTPDARKRLEHNLDMEREAHEQHRAHAAIRLSGEFHLLLADIAGNEVMARFLYDLVAHTSLAMALYEDSTRPACGEDEHEQLLEAIAEGHTDEALELMDTHLREIEDWLQFTAFTLETVDFRAVFESR
jgi:DNA-binding GntR family transcriptional regulator